MNYKNVVQIYLYILVLSFVLRNPPQIYDKRTITGYLVSADDFKPWLVYGRVHVWTEMGAKRKNTLRVKYPIKNENIRKTRSGKNVFSLAWFYNIYGQMAI